MWQITAVALMTVAGTSKLQHFLKSGPSFARESAYPPDPYNLDSRQIVLFDQSLLCVFPTTVKLAPNSIETRAGVAVALA
jgi:hypothetical protein